MKRLKLTLAVLVAALGACSPNPPPQPMGSSKPETVPPDASRPEAPAKKAEPAGEKKYPMTLSEEEWKKRLTPEQFAVCRMKGTERAFGKGYEDSERQGKGTYACVACGQILFESRTKFHSGTGWPSFDAPASEKSVEKFRDLSYGWDRVEVVCSHCGAHLGHVFNDGPTATGLRYCINSVCLKFNEEQKEK